MKLHCHDAVLVCGSFVGGFGEGGRGGGGGVCLFSFFFLFCNFFVILFQ